MRNKKQIMMSKNYWIKDPTRKEIITKTQIPNSGDFEFFATYYNLMDKQGLSLSLNFENNLILEKLYRKSGFEYLVIEHNNLRELYILPNDHIEEYANRVASKLNSCNNENAILNLLIAEM